jgi:hypothetical protein
MNVLNRIALIFGFITLHLVTLRPCAAESNWSLDLEIGAVISGYNDVRIPGNTGTLFSLCEDLETDPAIFGRLRLGCEFGGRHAIFLLIAPLRLRAEGTLNRSVDFEGVLFPSGTFAEGFYRFDSYRLTYRYDFHRSATLRAGAGLTAKIRDAEIRLKGEGREAKKVNTGFVPLLNFQLAWCWSRNLALIFSGDALAAPQGRAEDVSLALAYQISSKVQLKGGYRLLEGGANNDEVYSFALLHYILVGAGIRL